MRNVRLPIKASCSSSCESPLTWFCAEELLTIPSHRATRIDPATRLSRLTSFVEPVKNQWKDESLKQALGSYNGFCELLGLDKAQKYIAERRAHEVADWGSAELDAEGLALQAELERRQSVCCGVSETCGLSNLV